METQQITVTLNAQQVEFLRMLLNDQYRRDCGRYNAATNSRDPVVRNNERRNSKLAERVNVSARLLEIIC